MFQRPRGESISKGGSDWPQLVLVKYEEAMHRLWIKQCNFIDDSYRSFFSGVMRGTSINGVGPRERGSM